jgi:uncharacterized ferredoxin-like protein
MSKITAAEAELKAVREVAALMAASARTAPKTRGVDTIQLLVVDGDDLQVLAEALERNASGRDDVTSKGFLRDARNLRGSLAVVLIGTSGGPRKPEVPMDCGACASEHAVV